MDVCNLIILSCRIDINIHYDFAYLLLYLSLTVSQESANQSLICNRNEQIIHQDYLDTVQHKYETECHISSVYYIHHPSWILMHRNLDRRLEQIQFYEIFLLHEDIRQI